MVPEMAGDEATCGIKAKEIIKKAQKMLQDALSMSVI